MKYPLSEHAASLALLRTDADSAAASLHATMQDAGRRACVARNRLIDLLLGEGEFTGTWVPIAEAGNDPGWTEPHMREICLSLVYARSPLFPLADLTVRFHLCRLALRDPDHPLVVAREVLRAACYPFVDNPVRWPEVEQAIESGREAARAAASDAAWQEQARQWREAEAKRVADAEAKARHDAEFAAASLQNMPSGYRVDTSASIVTTSND